MVISEKFENLKNQINDQPEERRVELLKRFVKTEFIVTQKWINSLESDAEYQRHINLKIEEWNKLDGLIFEEWKGYSGIELEIRGEEIVNKSLNLFPSDELVGNSDGDLEVKKWHFSFPVLLRGKFEEIFINCARFAGGLKVGSDEYDKRRGQISSCLEVKEMVFLNVECQKTFQVNHVKFLNKAIFASCNFVRCKVSFWDVHFFDEAVFSSLNLQQSSFEISHSEFAGAVNCFVAAADRSEVCLIHNQLKKSLLLGINSGEASIKTLDLGSSIFEGTVIIYQMKGARLDVEKLNLDWAIFRDILAVKLERITNVPNFFKANFIDQKKLSLIESWKIKEIEKDDEENFRFLKKYFAEQGNHFKEMEYFSYEMMAREDLLRSKVFSGSEIKKDCCEWLKNIFEFALFFVYKWTSNFGMSWPRPAACLIFSFYWFGSFFDKIGLESPWIKSFVRTFNLILPLASDVERLPMLAVFLTAQSLFNAILIFLLVLGIRNKFKIK